MKISNKLHISLICFALFLSPINYAVAQQVDISSRPSFSVYSLIFSDLNKLESGDLNLNDSYLSERAFIDITGNINMNDLGLTPETVFNNGNNATDGYKLDEISEALDAYLNRMNLGQQIISYQFDIDDNFVWNYVLLAQRGVESQTFREAQQALASERGSLGTASSAFLEILTRSYVLFMLLDVNETERTNLLGATEKNYTTSKNVFLFKLDYDSIEEVATDLGGFFCGEHPCGDKKEKFNQHQIPIKLLNTASSSTLRGTTDGNDLNASSYTDMVLNNAYTLASQGIKSLQIRTFVSDIRPISAMIGRREGLKKGRRYRAVRQTLDDDNEIVDRNRGFVRGKVVTDNRMNVTQLDSLGNEFIVEFPPSQFIQVHGTSIGRGDVLVENPDFGILINSFGAFGAYSSIGVEISYMLPNSVGNYVSLVFDLSFEDEVTTDRFFQDVYGGSLPGTRTLLLQGGIGVAKDFYIANGNFRLTPKAAAVYNTAFFVSDDANTDDILEDFSLNNLGGKIGADFSIQFRENVGLFGGLQYTYLTDVYTFAIDGLPYDADSDYKSYFNNHGMQLKLGFRVSF